MARIYHDVCTMEMIHSMPPRYRKRDDLWICWLSCGCLSAATRKNAYDEPSEALPYRHHARGI